MSPLPHQAPRTFGQRLADTMDEVGPLCVGIDPHRSLLDAWGLTDTPDGVRTFGLRVVEALAGSVAAVKPQVAFFERHGSAGIAALEEVLAAAAAADLLTIADAKRGDIDSTMAAYADTFLADGSALAADAVTVSPYLGFGSLRPALDLAMATGRGLFVLCLTSNPQGASVQHARSVDGVSVAAQIAREAALENADAARMGAVVLVVGATIADAAHETGVDLTAVRGPLLAPGVGAQGAGAAELAAVFGPARPNVLAASSRAVLGAGPDAAALRRAATNTAHEIGIALRG